MAGGAIGAVGRQIERVFAGGGLSGLSEGQLLERFVTRKDDAAFEALVARHGPMVVGVCRKLLRDSNDVDDAFQATFLVLVRKAGSLRRRELLGNWLYGVAFKVASRARSVAIKRQTTETSSDAIESLAFARSGDEAVGSDEGLHEELHRLPEKYRAPLVLCYLEGLTHEQAADQLSWPVGTVKGRLSRARDLLRTRLVRRGVTFALAGTMLERLPLAARAALPGRLVIPTVQAAAKVAAGQAAVGVLSTQAVALYEGVVHVMTITKIKAALASIALAGTLATSAGAVAYHGFGPGQGAASADNTKPAAKPAA